MVSWGDDSNNHYLNLLVHWGQVRQTFTYNSTRSRKVTGLWASMWQYSEDDLGNWICWGRKICSFEWSGLMLLRKCLQISVYISPFSTDFEIAFHYVLWNLLLFSITTIKMMFMVSAEKCIISSLPPPWKLLGFYPHQWDIRTLYENNNGLFIHP